MPLSFVEERPAVRRRRRMAGAFVCLSLVIWLFFAACYATRADEVAAITVFPAWVWIIPGLVTALLGFFSKTVRWWAAALLALWAVYSFLWVDEARALRHLPNQAPDTEKPPAAGQLRVITLNCAGGVLEAAKETIACHPDIVLLQESPGPQEVQALGQQWFGKGEHTFSGVDASLITRGTAERLAPKRREDQLNFVAARVTLAGKQVVYVVSLRLVPTVFRMDLWSPDCWQEQTRNRRQRREQLQVVADWLETLPSDAPIIVGGDFNAPAGDAVFALLEKRGLRDTFVEAGVGAGDTIINDMPFHRIDQIWVRGAQPLSAAAQKTVNSDHCLVVSDIRLAETRKQP
jgi:vancomycin resistance protein VanJ